MNKLERILWLIVIGLAVALFFSLNRGKEIEVREIRTTDTVVVLRVDTIIEHKTRYIKERVVDTVYLPSQNPNTDGDSYPLLITQRHYSKPNLYDLWVSGYEPNLDSIRVYQQTKYININNDTTKEVYPKSFRLYFGGGFFCIEDKFAPSLSLTLTTPKRIAITANIGLYNKEVLYGAQVQCKILGK